MEVGLDVEVGLAVEVGLDVQDVEVALDVEVGLNVEVGLDVQDVEAGLGVEAEQLYPFSTKSKSRRGRRRGVTILLTTGRCASTFYKVHL